MARNWTEAEVDAAVDDYFEMLRLELNGRTYNKSEHRRRLLGQLSNRSEGAVELKHQNISAVLIEMGIPFIEGYKPRGNYQRNLLPAAIDRYIKANRELAILLECDADLEVSVPPVGSILDAIERAPRKREQSKIADEPAARVPAKINYLEREARNQSLGDAGERFVLNFERARLIHAGLDSLADRIERVSETVGPSAGFDIRSFNSDGTDRFIEAKTTKYGKETPFYVTPNELRFSHENAHNYRLYRVFRFRREPRFFALSGSLYDRCHLAASQYTAVPA